MTMNMADQVSLLANSVAHLIDELGFEEIKVSLLIGEVSHIVRFNLDVCL